MSNSERLEENVTDKNKIQIYTEKRRMFEVREEYIKIRDLNTIWTAVLETDITFRGLISHAEREFPLFFVARKRALSFRSDPRRDDGGLFRRACASRREYDHSRNGSTLPVRVVGPRV